jgi:hypothetical protein
MSRPHGQAPARNWNNSSSRTTVDLVASLDQEQRRAVEKFILDEPILELMTITEYAMSNTFCWIFC